MKAIICGKLYIHKTIWRKYLYIYVYASGVRDGTGLNKPLGTILL